MHQNTDFHQFKVTDPSLGKEQQQRKLKGAFDVNYVKTKVRNSVPHRFWTKNLQNEKKKSYVTLYRALLR